MLKTTLRAGKNSSTIQKTIKLRICVKIGGCQKPLREFTALKNKLFIRNRRSQKFMYEFKRELSVQPKDISPLLTPDDEERRVAYANLLSTKFRC